MLLAMPTGLLLMRVWAGFSAVVACRNAQHYSRFTHVPSLLGRPGFWDTVKGWGLGMCQVSSISQSNSVNARFTRVL
jgi:hypothetical protein